MVDKLDEDLCLGMWDTARGSIFFKWYRQSILCCSGLHLPMFSTKPGLYFWIQAAAWSLIFGFQCIANEHLAWDLHFYSGYLFWQEPIILFKV